MRSRAARAGTAAAFVLLAAAAAGAATVPAGDVLRVARRIDSAAVARAVRARYDVDVRRVVVADIDRDGDADVLAATDLELVVWVNDGAGRLVSQPPARAPLVGLQPPGRTWDRHSAPGTDTIQNDLPTPRPSSRVTAPPDAMSAPTDVRDAARATSARASTRTPRAPPTDA
jgi:hypothetical protein